MVTISAVMVKALRDRTSQSIMDCKRALTETEGEMDKAIALLRKKGVAVMEKRSGRETKEGHVVSVQSTDGRSAAIVLLCCETDFTAKNEEFQKSVTAIANGLLSAPTVPKTLEELLSVSLEGGQDISATVNSIVSKTGEKIAVGGFARFDLEGPGLLHSYIHFNGKIGTLVQLEVDTEEAVGCEELKGLVSDLAMHITAENPTAVNREEIDEELVAKEREVALSQVKGKPENIIDKIVKGKLNKWYQQMVLLEQPFVKDPDKRVQEILSSVGKEIGSEIRLKRFSRVQVG